MILPFNRLSIGKNDLVLEIGSGHRPSYRADVLCDKYLEDEQRGGPIKIDRPFVIADCDALPFENKSFDYIICSQVLEHVDDPSKCCGELTRVGKKGYLESPSIFWEKLHPTREYHKWFLLLIDDNLVFYSKDRCEKNSIFGEIFEIMYSNSLEYHLFFRSYQRLFEIKYEWADRINCVVNPKDNYLSDFFLKPWTKNNYRKFCDKKSISRQILGVAGNFCSLAALFALNRPRMVFGEMLLGNRKRQLNINLEEYLVCSSCRGELTFSEGEIKCLKCGLIYKYTKGIPDMLVNQGYGKIK